MPTIAGKAIVPFEGDFTGLITSAAEAAKKVGDGFLKGPTEVLAILGVSLAATAGIALDLGAKFNAAEALLAANAGITIKQAQAIGTAFLATGGQTTFTAQQMIAAFTPVSAQLELLNGGALTAAQSLQVMNAAMALSEATGQPLVDTTRALADLMVAYGLGADQASTASDVLFKVSGDLNQSVDQVATTMDKLHGRLGEATPPLSQVAALMVDLAQNGVPAKQAVAGAGAAIISLIDPSKSAAKELAALNVTTLDSHGSFVGLDSIISQLKPKFDGMTQAQQLQTAANIFGKPAAEAMLAVITKGPAAFDALTKSVSASGSAQSGANTATNTLGGSWDRLKSNVIDYMTKAGTPLNNLMKQLVDWLNNSVVPAVKNVIKWFGDHKTATQALGIALGVTVAGLVAFKVAMVALKIVEGITTSITMLRLGLAGATAAEAGTTAGAYALGTGFVSLTASARTLLSVLTPVVAAYSVITAAQNLIPYAGKGLPSSAPGSAGGSDNWFQNLWNTFTRRLSGHFATGGYIPPGQWGMTGEQGPEPIYGGNTGVTVLPNSTLGGAGGTAIFNRKQAGTLGMGGITQHINNHFYGSPQEMLAEMDARVASHNAALVRALGGA